jgi:hypothetical protein
MTRRMTSEPVANSRLGWTDRGFVTFVIKYSPINVGRAVAGMGRLDVK